MPAEFDAAFHSLQSVLKKHQKQFVVSVDAPGEYTLVTKIPSTFPQHKGEPLYFAGIRIGKAYVALHLLPLYMCPALGDGISPDLKKRRQGKACFNFKIAPSPALIAELQALVETCKQEWIGRKWA